ncbi:hypothetical protein SteCoe_21105 [Stentor coeruleus]|uniref:Uncharacterized protein n=1 Tax=Stentor coeruleus TaxID=5963 RepID=A0A1R2BQC5_9CILI|nr:hypothetical protein SteCoe_21105 [Stentor coeruleus]
MIFNEYLNDYYINRVSPKIPTELGLDALLESLYKVAARRSLTRENMSKDKTGLQSFEIFIPIIFSQ